jgi:hypothetical protein
LLSALDDSRKRVRQHIEYEAVMTLDPYDHPIHAEIRFTHLPGTLFVSSLHLINLTGIVTSNAAILSTVSMVAPELSRRITSQLEYASSRGPDELLRTQSETVRYVAAMSTLSGF